MPDIQQTNLAAIADAIRAKDGTSELIRADTFAQRILSIPTGGFEAELVVEVDDGALVTARNGALTVTGTSANGKAVLILTEAGEWTVTATKDGKESNTVIVPVFREYSAKLALIAGELVYDGTAAPLSAARQGARGEAAGNYALFMGGSGGIKIVDAYDLSLTRHIPDAMSYNRVAHFAGHVGGYALSAGGQGHIVASDAYDKDLTHSNPPALFTTYTQGGASATAGDFAFFAGGIIESAQSRQTSTNTVRCYDGALTVSSATTLPASVTGEGSVTTKTHAVFAGGAYYLGATLTYTYQKKAAAYDAEKTRVLLADLDTARYTTGALAGEHALFAGGADATARYATVDVYSATLEKLGSLSLSSARRNIAAASLEGFAIFAGGYTGSAVVDTVDVFDASLTRQTPQGLSAARHYSAGAAVGNHILFAGGSTGAGTTPTTDAVDVYSLK